MENQSKPATPQYLCDYWDCHEFTHQHCAGCKPGDSIAYYCSRAHQRACWPAHKPCCAENDAAVDGYALAALVYKVVEGVDPRLDTLQHCETRVTKHEQGNDVQIVLHHPQFSVPMLVRSSDTFCRLSEQVHPAVDADGAELVRDDEQCARDETLCRMSYWALRCMSGGFTLNKVFIDVLEALRLKGYKRLCFGPVALSLLQEPRLELLHLRPRHRVTVQVDGVEQPVSAQGLLCYVLVLDGHAVDLGAGQHWVFDEAPLYRPLAVMLQPLYHAVMGELVDDTAKLKKEEMLRERLARNPHIAEMTELVLLNLGVYTVENKEHQDGATQ